MIPSDSFNQDFDIDILLLKEAVRHIMNLSSVLWKKEVLGSDPCNWFGFVLLFRDCTVK